MPLSRCVRKNVGRWAPGLGAVELASAEPCGRPDAGRVGRRVCEGTLVDHRTEGQRSRLRGQPNRVWSYGFDSHLAAGPSGVSLLSQARARARAANLLLQVKSTASICGRFRMWVSCLSLPVKSRSLGHKNRFRCSKPSRNRAQSGRTRSVLVIALRHILWQLFETSCNEG